MFNCFIHCLAIAVIYVNCSYARLMHIFKTILDFGSAVQKPVVGYKITTQIII